MKAAASILAACATMVLLSAPADSIGLVFSGGGAKGAYEVGVWKALDEAGLSGRVVAVSGTSIGAVNAALFASCGSPAVAERLWLENLSKVFVPNEKVLQLASQKKYAALLEKRLAEGADAAGVAVEELPSAARQAIEREAGREFAHTGVLNDLAAALKAYQETCAGEAADGLLDGDALKAVIERNLPEVWPESAPSAYVTAIQCDAWKSRSFRLNALSHEERVKRILASAALPVALPPVGIDGVNYVDGGWEAKGGDNVPIRPILENHPDVKTVIVVYLNDAARIPRGRRERVRREAAAAGVELVEIVPRKNIDGDAFGWEGVWDVSPETARSLIDLGRTDAPLQLR